MVSTVINTRADLDAIAGTPAHAEFMGILAGTLYRLEKDDAAQTWRAIEDESTAARFGFVRADFPNVQPPDLPEYVPEVIAVPAVVTMRQARLALLQVGLLSQVNTAVAAADEATKITWEFSSEVQRNNALVSTLAAALTLTSQQLDDLFTLAATL
jgi:hypothetical protein